MIIHDVHLIKTTNVAEYSWRKIAQFNNNDFTTNLICRLHQLNSNQRGNAKNQAEQIRFCLSQAKEYYDASIGVSLATRPVLLYYSTMSLALSEILLKQSGNSRLSKLRENHSCHGLALSLSSEPGPTETLNNAASKMIAKPQFGQQGLPKGTFEVWRRSAREYPIAGYFTQWYEGANTTRFATLFSPENIPPPILSSKGISLYDCLTNLPYMADTLMRWGSRLEMVRARVNFEQMPSAVQQSCTMSIHPTSLDLLDTFYSLCRMPAAYGNTFNINELPSGCVIKWDLHNKYHMQLPHSTCINSEDVYFTCSTDNLGEFGYIYIALHILGNFARYYPDCWMKHIEMNSPLANAADDLCSHALERLPLLSLSELSRVYHVLK